MKVRIGAIEISDVSLDELDELVKRYGTSTIQSADNEGNGSGDSKHRTHPKAGNSTHGNTTDTVVLRQFVEAGNQGVPTEHLGEMLGRRGKATRGAAREWAHRIGIVSDASIDPFEDTRVGTKRGLRIKPSLMAIAAAHLGK